VTQQNKAMLNHNTQSFRDKQFIRNIHNIK